MTEAQLNYRCPAPTALNRGDDLNSIRRVAHRHGVVCLTLAKWETVSGQFGRYRRTEVMISTRSVGLLIDTGLYASHLPSGRPCPVSSGAISRVTAKSTRRIAMTTQILVRNN